MNDGLDLPLLTVFDELLRERNVTRAARKLGLSQPAVSHSLSRLRLVFGDALFVRSRDGMTPTPTAERLAPRVKDLLLRARALTQPIEFEAASLERAFTVGGVDFMEGYLLPRVTPILLKESPLVSVISRPLSGDVSTALSDGRLDLAIGVLPTLPADAVTQHLFDDEFVCVVRKKHPRIRSRLTLDAFCALGHVLISPRGEPGSPVDSVLAGLGRTRRITVQTHTFLSAPLVVATSDLMLTGPKQVLEPMARLHGLVVLQPPFQLKGFSVHQAWHPRNQNDDAHKWFRGLIVRASKGR